MGRKGNSGYTNPDARFGTRSDFYSGSLGLTQHYLERLDGDLEPELQPAPGYSVWSRSTQGVTADGSNNVSQWDDLSGNGNHFKQSVSGDFPAFNSSNAALNDLPSIDANNGDSMETDDDDTLDASGGFCLYVVAKLDSYPSTFSFFVSRTNGTTWGTGWGIYYYAGKLRFFVDYWNTSAKRVELDGAGTSNANIYKFHYDQSTITAALIGPDAESGTQAQTSTDINAPGEGISLNRGGSDAYDGDWDYGEVIFYPLPLSAAGQQQTEEYLKIRYNIS